MSDFLLPLDAVEVATPCPARWDSMAGTDRVRFCQQCQLNVYNLSAMALKDAEALIAEHEGRLCIRYFRRLDGTVLTTDCPVGVRSKARHPLVVAATAAAWVLGLFCGSLAFLGSLAWEHDKWLGSGIVPNRPPVKQTSDAREFIGKRDDGPWRDRAPERECNI
jgi:hypothetical protein